MSGRRKCAECEKSHSIERIHSVYREAGGSYKRSNRRTLSSICDDCVIELVPRCEHSMSVRIGSANWSRDGIIRAARDMNWQGPLYVLPYEQKFRSELAQRLMEDILAKQNAGSTSS